LVSFGGSLGAETVNREILNLMRAFSAKRKDIFHIHATGKSGYGEFYRIFSEMQLNECKNISVKEYIYDMPRWISAADLVICRSGAMTLSEIASAGRASILIPSPNVVDNHQYKNATAFSDAGAAFTLCEGEDLIRLCALTETVLSDRAVREGMEEKARSFNLPNAAEMIAGELIILKSIC
jgi:UDP-N-acetylglucosamine--N-acetylmuramyl-(pentapeptide) pyrophosphoryl-undecaprenol N-acetylglucosamine transferase